MGLDVSTTTAGWAIFESVDERPILGYISLAKAETLYDKAVIFQDGLEKLLKQYAVSEIFLEEDLQKFTRGKSSAAVLQKLSRFNGMASLISFQLSGKPPVHLNVNAARRLVGCKIDRADKELTTKEKVFEWAVNDSMLRDYPWPTRVVFSGPRKGEIEKLKEVGDMIDAYIVAHAGFLSKT